MKERLIAEVKKEAQALREMHNEYMACARRLESLMVSLTDESDPGPMTDLGWSEVEEVLTAAVRKSEEEGRRFRRRLQELEPLFRSAVVDVSAQKIA